MEVKIQLLKFSTLSLPSNSKLVLSSSSCLTVCKGHVPASTRMNPNQYMASKLSFRSNCAPWESCSLSLTTTSHLQISLSTVSVTRCKILIESTVWQKSTRSWVSCLRQLFAHSLLEVRVSALKASCKLSWAWLTRTTILLWAAETFTLFSRTTELLTCKSSLMTQLTHRDKTWLWFLCTSPHLCST